MLMGKTIQFEIRNTINLISSLVSHNNISGYSLRDYYAPSELLSAKHLNQAWYMVNITKCLSKKLINKIKTVNKI